MEKEKVEIEKRYPNNICEKMVKRENIRAIHSKGRQQEGAP